MNSGSLASAIKIVNVIHSGCGFGASSVTAAFAGTMWPMLEKTRQIQFINCMNYSK
jgi:hypothetical protein